MSPETYQPILDWISNHPHWAGFIVFLISLSESLAIVGLIVPGIVLMTAIGGMMGSGILPFWLTLMWAILGAIAGDGISYWLGYHYHQHLRDFWPFKQFPGLLARGETFFKAHGGKSIIFGRFVGPVRPMIPVIAGMMDMKPKRFLIFNILSAIVWAPLYSLPGILIGASLGKLSPEAAHRVGFLVVILLLLLWLIYIFARTIGRVIIQIIEKIMHHLWHRAHHSKKFAWLIHILQIKQGTEHGQLGLFILSIISFLIFAFIVILVVVDHDIIQFNENITQLLRALYSPKYIDAFTLITGLGDPYVILTATAAVSMGLLYRHKLQAFFCWTTTIFFGYLIGHVTKHLSAIPRPEGLIYTSSALSFPSGHVLCATLFYGLATLFIQHHLKSNLRWIIWFFTTMLILVIAFSRLYLGIHWVTDVAAGLFLGIFCITLGYSFYRAKSAKLFPLRSILIPGILILTIAMVLYSTLWYPQKRGTYSREWVTYTLSEADWWTGKDNTQVLISRKGVLKKLATIFDIQWLGTLKDIEIILNKLDFKPLPKLTLNSSLAVLEDNPSPMFFPVMPKFHRDRLPALILAKTINKDKRLVLQIWQSDFYTKDNLPLWVGTLREETLAHPLPLTSIYKENLPSQGVLLEFQKLLNYTSKITSEIIFLQNQNTQNAVLLIRSKS